MSALVPAGWYADPAAPTQQRYWDGSRWTRWVYTTADSRPAGQTLTTVGRSVSRVGVNWMLVVAALVALMLIVVVL